MSVKFTVKAPLLLASQSPARAQLLKEVGLDFTVLTSPFDEEQAKLSIQDLSIPQQAAYLAREKARVVSEQHPASLVLAADQIGELQGEALFKPLTQDHNIALLQRLSGQVHWQHTAACVFFQGALIQEFFESVALQMRELNDNEIDTYVNLEKPYHCCGGYRYEGLGKHLFYGIDGSYESVLGLPLLQILYYLHVERWIRFE